MGYLILFWVAYFTILALAITGTDMIVKHLFKTKIKTISNRDNTIVKTTTHAGAYDISAKQDYIVRANTLGNLIDTGISIQPSNKNVQCLLLPRSSIGTKTPLRYANSVGLIDSDYTGTIKVCVDNVSNEDYVIKKNERIGQLLFVRPELVNIMSVDKLKDTKRGVGGFGSTGK